MSQSVSLSKARMDELLKRASGGMSVPPAAAAAPPPEALAVEPVELTGQDANMVVDEMAKTMGLTQFLVNGKPMYLPIAAKADSEIKRSIPTEPAKTVPFDDLTAEQKKALLNGADKAQQEGAKGDEVRPAQNDLQSVKLTFPKLKKNEPITEEAKITSNQPSKDSTVQPEAPAPVPESTPVLSAEMPVLCPRCHWDQRLQDTVVLSDVDQRVYKAAFLCGERFTETVELVGGDLRLTFRELSPSELDATWSQVLYDARSENLTQHSGMERHMRYRLALQLTRFDAGGAKPRSFVLKEGLSPKTCPRSESQWLTDDELHACDDYLLGNRGIRLIAEQLDELIFSSESLYRVCTEALHDFNRKVAKLEVLVKEKNFS